MEKKAKNIGLKVAAVTKTCQDKKCPFHSQLKVRGRTFVGTIISGKMHNTATVEWNRKVKIPKYERYEKKRSRIKVHNPECLGAQEGDMVKVAECRPLSKTKHFVVVENYGFERGFIEKMEARETAKVKKKPVVETAEATETKDMESNDATD
jgi:small subunit ribosomal protein S17